MSFPRRIEAVVFDMDGLLVDTESVFLTAMSRAAAEAGLDYPLAFHRTLIGTTHAVGERLFLDAYGHDFDLAAFRARTFAVVDEIRREGLRLKAGVLELLDHLDALGLPSAIATSSGHATVEAHLGWSGIVPRFQAVIADGDYARSKPHPDPFLAAARALDVDPAACLALEDSHNGVRAAHAAGMMVVMVPDLLEPTAEMHGLCVRIADSLHEVHSLLGGPPEGDVR